MMAYGSRSATRALRRAGVVVFDVDSTVMRTEGIVELAREARVEELVDELTHSAMGVPDVDFGESLRRRLEIIRPSREMVSRVAGRRPLPLTEGVEDFVSELHSCGKKVFLVSGGFVELIHPVADVLSIPREHVFANVLQYTPEGAYSGFDASQPTAASGGKAKAIERILASEPPGTEAVMIGDGVTDAEARPPAKAFIGFGGVVHRKAVEEKADLFLHSFKDAIEMVRAE